MKPEEREDARYAKEEFCPISLEEQKMFQLLKAHQQKLGVQPKDVAVLDIGCGSGRISQQLMEYGYTVQGLDFSEEAVKKALAKGVSAKQANLDEGIPEPNARYDVVWAGDIVEHVFDPIGLLRESERVLKPGGVILITIPSDVGLVSRLKMLFGISHQEQMYMTSGFYKHHTFFTPRLIRYMLGKSSLTVESFETILILGKQRLSIPSSLSSAFFNEMIISARKHSSL